jgi:hypothetical protein
MVPARGAPGGAAGAIASAPSDARLLDARAALTAAIAGAAGLFVRADAAAPTAAPGRSITVDVEVVARAAPVTLERVAIAGAAPTAVGATLPRGERRITAVAVPLPASAPPSVAPWLARPPGPGRYEVADPRHVAVPRPPAALTATVDVVIAGRRLALTTPVVHAWTDRVHGERVRPFTIVPPATATPLREAVLTTGRPAPLALRVRAGHDAFTGEVALELPPGWRAAPASHAVQLAKAGDEVTLRFDVSAEPRAAAGEARPVVRSGGGTYSLREDLIDYPHIPLQLVLRPAAVRLVPLELRVPAGRVGYVRGSGDTVAADLAHVGFAVDELDDEALRAGDLGRYAAVILGIRAYNARPAVRDAHARLMAYAERGGTLIMQYNTLDLTGPIGPYRLELGRDRITDEAAAPTAIDPRHPLLTRPNRLGAADWEGWVQERGLYFAEQWDARYRPVLRFADPGEAPVEGALLVAPHGRGRYIYTGLALFRQLPAGVPGAYRLLANLIGGGK